jgi:XTP/dITP diphosphohydrolase
MNIVLATQNPHKVAEIRAVLPATWKVWLPSDFGLTAELREDGRTLEANAEQKARFLWEHTGMPSLADDSGLEVEALAGAPGVDSAHYAGPERSDSANRSKLLGALHGVENRRARFKTVLAWATDDGVALFEGTVEGQLGECERGTHGFGYDALFIPLEGDGRSFAEMSAEEKSAISHRSRAVAAWRARLEKS